MTQKQSVILLYFKVYFALIGLLALTIWVSSIHLNLIWSTVFSLGIAAVKAALVLSIFMELKKSIPKIRFFAFAAGVWTLLLISLVSIDYFTRGLIGVLGK